MVLKSGMDIFEAYDNVFVSSLGYLEEINRATLRWKIRKYETLFAMALIKGYPPAVHLAADIIFHPGMQKFAAQTRKSIFQQDSKANINKIDKCLDKCLKKSRTIYHTFVTLALQRGAGITRDMGEEFVKVMLPHDDKTHALQHGAGITRDMGKEFVEVMLPQDDKTLALQGSAGITLGMGKEVC